MWPFQQNQGWFYQEPDNSPFAAQNAYGNQLGNVFGSGGPFSAVAGLNSVNNQAYNNAMLQQMQIDAQKEATRAQLEAARLGAQSPIDIARINQEGSNSRFSQMPDLIKAFFGGASGMFGSSGIGGLFGGAGSGGINGFQATGSDGKPFAGANFGQAQGQGQIPQTPSGNPPAATLPRMAERTGGPPLGLEAYMQKQLQGRNIDPSRQAAMLAQGRTQFGG